MNIVELQSWLNAHGATPKLVEDGKAGTLTRAAIIQVFVNKDAKPLFTTIQNVNSYQYNGYYSSLSTNSIPIIVGIKVGWRFKDVHDCNCIRQ